MTILQLEGKCPTCGYKFKDAKLMTGEAKIEGANGICCMCGEIFKIEDGKIRVLTAREFLHLHPIDSLNISVASGQIDSRNQKEAARGN